MADDSALSIAASITGILTFVAAVMAGFWAHSITIRNAIDTQAELSNALEKIDFLETETEMLNNVYQASLIRQPDRKYGSGDYNYLQGKYVAALERMRRMDRGLRKSAVAVTGTSYDQISRVKTAATWMAARQRIHKDIEERKAESARIFQIQLAILSAKIDELSYHQNHHNARCDGVVTEIESLKRDASPRIRYAGQDAITLKDLDTADTAYQGAGAEPAIPLCTRRYLDRKEAESPGVLTISIPSSPRKIVC